LSEDLESRIDDFVGLQGGDEHVEDPVEHEDGRGNDLDRLGPAELASDGGGAPGEQDEDGEQSLDTEDRHGESQAADGHEELGALNTVVDGGHGPGDTNTEEDVDGVGAGDVTNGGVSGLVLNGGGLGSEGI